MLMSFFEGLVFPFSVSETNPPIRSPLTLLTSCKVGGIIILGLVVSSIHRFAGELGSSHLIRNHAQKQRDQMLDRSTVDEDTFERMKSEDRPKILSRSSISGPFNKHKVSDVVLPKTEAGPTTRRNGPIRRHVRTGLEKLKRVRSREPKILLLREEKTRFEAMRAIQHSTHRFKAYSALTMSIFACK